MVSTSNTHPRTPVGFQPLHQLSSYLVPNGGGEVLTLVLDQINHGRIGDQLLVLGVVFIAATATLYVHTYTHTSVGGLKIQWVFGL